MVIEIKISKISKSFLILIGFSLIFFLSIYFSSEQGQNQQVLPCIAPEGCVCSLVRFNESIKDMEVVSEYLRVTQDPNSGTVCRSQKEQKISKFPAHCGVIEGGCDDYNCNTDEVCLEDGSCLYTPKPCRDNDDCCPNQCIGRDNDCPNLEGCIENCKDDCTELCGSFTELRYFICDFCTGPDCQQKCNDATQKQQYICDACEPQCDSSCQEQTCISPCDGFCDSNCYRVDPDCYSCLMDTCDLANNRYCNDNCQWTTPMPARCLSAYDCQWSGNCVTLTACGGYSITECGSDVVDCGPYGWGYCILFNPPRGAVTRECITC